MTSLVGYALLTGMFAIQNQLTIKGIGVQVDYWITDTTPPTTPFTTMDWGSRAPDEVIYTVNLCVKNVGNTRFRLQFATNLPSTVGTVVWQIEWKDASLQWQWLDWQNEINLGHEIKGSELIPIEPNEVVGMRPSSNNIGDLGNIRIKLTVAADAPYGAVAPFTITVTGTEVP